jgi:hypothetical protein
MKRLTNDPLKEAELETACGQHLSLDTQIKKMRKELAGFEKDYKKLRKIIIDLMRNAKLDQARVGEYKVYLKKNGFLTIRGG